MDGRGSGVGVGWRQAVGQVDTHPTDLTPHSRADGVGAKVSLAAGWSRHKGAGPRGLKEPVAAG